MLEMMDSSILSTASSFDEFKDVRNIDLHIFGKNVQSLQTDAREKELLEELGCFDWDIVLLNETWRSQAQERWTTDEGHMFCGASGEEQCRGVAILVNRRWVRGYKAFLRVSDRLCAVDIKIDGRTFRFISAYFPHGGYEDEEVEAMYSNLDGLINAARRKRWTCVVFGDWNAVVGPGQEEDDQDSIGSYGIGRRNDRGKWLARWASLQQLMIANTTFEKHPEQQWTYKNGDNKRQIDYFLISSAQSSCVHDAYASDTIGVGMDHRTVNLELHFQAKAKPSAKKITKKPQSLRGWKPRDGTEYKKEVAAALRPATDFSNLQKASLHVESEVLKAGRKCQVEKSDSSKTDDEGKAYLRALIEQRKAAKAEGDREAVVRKGKLIQKEIRRLDKIDKTAKVTKILEQFKDLGQLADVRKKGKKDCIKSVINKDGNECTGKKDVADAFAEFYEALYAKDEEYEYKSNADVTEVEAITAKEVRKQLKLMKKYKAADEAGIVAELLQEGGDDLMENLAQLFTEVLRPGAAVPSSWCSSSIKVLFKKGDPKLSENYRPVCIIPILYKLFSRIICERIKDILLAEQSGDQAGFRPGFGCEDHLFTMTIIAEKCTEFNIPLWVAAIDFSKAFDSINHSSIFEALQAHKVPMAYIDVLNRLYKDQTASVRCEGQSRRSKEILSAHSSSMRCWSKFCEKLRQSGRQRSTALNSSPT